MYSSTLRSSHLQSDIDILANGLGHVNDAFGDEYTLHAASPPAQHRGPPSVSPLLAPTGVGFPPKFGAIRVFLRSLLKTIYLSWRESGAKDLTELQAYLNEYHFARHCSIPPFDKLRMPAEWAKLLRQARTVDAICDGIKWPALVFSSYQTAREWLIDVTPLEKLKPVLDVEDCVVFYFGRCDASKTRPEDVLHLAVMPQSSVEAEPLDATASISADPLAVHAMNQAKQFAESSSKLRAMELLVQFIIQDSSYVLDAATQEEEDESVDWNVIFESVWETLEADGWSVSNFGEEMFYSLPDVEFFNFEVDKTVFKTKKQALMKAVEHYSPTESTTATALWDTMWRLMEELKHGKTMTMKKGAPIYITPIVESFASLKRDENMFASKKEAVLKFSHRMQLPTPKKPKTVALAVQPAAPIVAKSAPVVVAEPAASKTKKTVAVMDEDMNAPAPKKSLKRKMQNALQPVPAVAAPTSSRRGVQANYSWGLIWDVLLSELNWALKEGISGYEFVQPDGRAFMTEGDVMEYLITTELMPEVDRRLKERGAPTPEHEKENSKAANVNNAAARKAPKAKTVTDESDDVVEDATAAVEVPSTTTMRSKKELKPKKRLSYSKVASPSPTLTQKERFYAVKFGQIERVLKLYGWKWIDGPLGYIYCKPHVVVGNKMKTYSGKENLDYFTNKEAFEAYVRNNTDLMECIYNELYGPWPDTPHVVGAPAPVATATAAPAVAESMAVFDMESDDEPISATKPAKQPKKKVAAVGKTAKMLFVAKKKKSNVVVTTDSEEDAKTTKPDVPAASKAKKAKVTSAMSESDYDDESAPKKDGRLPKKKVWLDEDSCVRGVPAFEVKFANVYAVLKTKGWTFRSGQFGYDYFRPNTTKKNGILNETYYLSEADMEAHLKSTGEWAKIERRLIRAYEAAYQGLSSPQPTSSSSQEEDDGQSEVDMSSPVPGKFSRMWPRLRANGWTEKPPSSMNGEYFYTSPSGKAFTKQELELCNLEDLLKHQVKNAVVDLQDSSDDEDANMDNDEAEPDDEDEIAAEVANDVVVEATNENMDETMIIDEDADETMIIDDDAETEAITPTARETPIVKSTSATAAPSFLSPDETTTLKSDKVVARNVQQDFTPSPSDAQSKTAAGVSSPGKKSVHRQEIERILHNLSPGFEVDQMKHREAEWRTLTRFFDRCISEDVRRSVFLSGTPGTGKSALMRLMENHVVKAWQDAPKSTSLQVVNMNAMALGDAASMYKAIAAKVTQKEYASSDDAIAALNLAFKTSDTVTLLVMDEIDILLKGKGENDLYRLFEWAHHPFSSVIFVGIANSIDLTERYLPLLRSRECNPLSIVFQPYGYDAIMDIMKQRIVDNMLVQKPMVDYMAMAFLARKIASTTGDIRTVLSLCRYTLLKKLHDDSTAVVSMAEMLAAAKKGMDAHGINSLKTLPRMTQMVVFAAIKVESARAGVYNTHAVYDKFCALVRATMTASQLVTMGEFSQKLEMLEAQSLATIDTKKDVFKLYVSREDAEKYFKAESFFQQF
ncbi:Aste57867_23080 [Aphanomyces stellatus]|uniref:Aste57867_23080 protein n=1 Tax=Aphanomyces stellatus TaxID=120398 RepID=A0A485LLX9_9STRA|nr:hypothetical protein As57867_023009 [Aphanomyces stellatus]VFT99728.1 Aste57867_23080 [Aphanomyces stellatus]